MKNNLRYFFVYLLKKLGVTRESLRALALRLIKKNKLQREITLLYYQFIEEYPFPSYDKLNNKIYKKFLDSNNQNIPLYKNFRNYIKPGWEVYFESSETLQKPPNKDILKERINLCKKQLNSFLDVLAKHSFQISNKITYDSYENIYNRVNFNELINSRINFFSNPEFKSWNKTIIKDDNVDPIFLVGFPRSGTTLLDTILRSHASIDVLEEKPLINNLINEVKFKTNSDFSNLSKLDKNFIKKLRSSYFEDFNNFLPMEKEKIYVDKFPLNIIYIAEINRIFPNSKYILALRNPFDCVLSCFMQPFTPNEAMSNFYNLQDAAIFYDKVMELWTYYENKLNNINT